MTSGLLSDCASSSCSTRLHQVGGKGKVFDRPFHTRGSISFPRKKTLNCQSRCFSSNSTEWSLSAVSPVAMTADTYAQVIDGRSVANQIQKEVAAEVARLKDAFGIVPGLAVILVGSRKDSQTYVRNKKKACEAVGITSYEIHLPENSTEEEVLMHISVFNNDPSVHGILVQLPLPRHMDEQNILNAVNIEKDVDGFNPLNTGCLALQGREPLFVPCTPKGCMELLRRYGVELKGKRAVVIGRSNIVGMPAALLLQRENATVTVVHSRTNNPEEIVRQADIIIAACGVANLVRGSWLKPGAVVIDVGINPVDDPESPRGYRLVGDVCYEEACKVASAITPVPGGVGPMTIAMLLSNTLISAKRIHNVRSEVFNETSFDEWVNLAKAPALPASLTLYKELLGLGFQIVLLTGRSEEQRVDTEQNLLLSGYHSWERLILRGSSDHGTTAVVYKSGKRAELVAQGFRIHGSSGDQWSDLIGAPMATRSFKLPNPMYYIS